MITDLFSHKIHASRSDWGEKLVEIACIFAEFDGQPFDRNEIEERLAGINPRASFVARDRSTFRDEVSAYPAYLGLYHLEFGDRWILRLGESARRYLVAEEPDVAAFMLLQLSLFQYPNGMGVRYSSRNNRATIQANTWARTLQFLQNGIHVSPLRLICKGITADAAIREVSPLQGSISYEEAFILANDSRTNTRVSPNLSSVVEVLHDARSGRIHPPRHFERRFHVLNHTDFVIAPRIGRLSIRSPENEADRQQLLQKLEVLNSLALQFNGFDGFREQSEFEDAIREGAWGRYFDSISTLSADVVETLSRNLIDSVELLPPSETSTTEIQFTPPPIKYALRPREDSAAQNVRNRRENKLADPEVTKIKRQRSNLTHKIVLEQLDAHLRSLGANPLENEHIDLFAQIPTDGSFIFEVKSVSTDNLLSQARKGLSQLYEYRYRYQDEIGYDVNLCLVFPGEPSFIPWLQEYLCNDRGVAVCWFSEEGNFQYAPSCEAIVRPLL